MRISWEYIAGFFDGEGSVSTAAFTHRTGSYNTIVALAQSGKEGERILNAIRDFLWERGIKSYVRAGTPNGKYRLMHYLRISARPSVTAFLAEMLPRASVKHVVVQDTWRFLKMYASTSGLATIERNKARGKYGSTGLNREQLLRDLAELGTRKAVAQKYGVNAYTITKYLDPSYRERYDAYRREWRKRRLAVAYG